MCRVCKIHDVCTGDQVTSQFQYLQSQNFHLLFCFMQMQCLTVQHSTGFHSIVLKITNLLTLKPALKCIYCYQHIIQGLPRLDVLHPHRKKPFGLCCKIINHAVLESKYLRKFVKVERTFETLREAMHRIMNNQHIIIK